MGIYDEWNMQCPRCGSDTAICIQIKVMARIRCDGTDIGDCDHEWDDDSIATCRACYGGCGFCGTVSDFEAVSVIEGKFNERIDGFQADLKSGKITEPYYEKLRKAAEDKMCSSIRLLRLIHDAPGED